MGCGLSPGHWYVLASLIMLVMGQGSLTNPGPSTLEDPCINVVCPDQKYCIAQEECHLMNGVKNCRSKAVCRLHDSCLSYPCMNGGSCYSSDQADGYGCSCPTGFTGKNCQKIEVGCASNPCINDGLCTPLGTDRYVCVCNSGFEGTFCDQFVDTRCSREPGICKNGGYCEPLGSEHYRCHCNFGYSGTNCEYHDTTSTTTTRPPNPEPLVCKNVVCPDQQYCIEQEECRLMNGIQDCRSRAVCRLHDSCLSYPCMNGGSCYSSDQADGYGCSCPTGFTGKNCQKIEVGCASNPCMNDGLCTPLGTDRYVCVCDSGFEGTFCEQFVGTRCSREPDICKNGGYCEPLGNERYRCQCNFGYSGTNCEYHDTTSTTTTRRPNPEPL